MGLRVYNTLTRKKEDFQPVRPGQVGIYLCGPTVYMYCHLGHLVGPVVFDCIKRYLEYRGYKTTLVVNITDVDDKLIKRAGEEGRSVRELAEDVTADYFAVLEKLKVSSIDHFPRATEHIADIIKMVEGLQQKGFAYRVDGDVYFDIAKAKDYGKLSGQRIEELEAGARVAPDERLKNPLDFCLWKSSKAGEPAWDSPWGKGRPGWHIECSVMSMRYLGDSFDIHGGGVDLVFPHHENETAQSESYTGKPFARSWLHHGLSTFKGEKLSKSTGNIIPAADLLKRYHPETVRFLLLSTHYRRPLAYSEERLEEVGQALQNFYRFFQRVERLAGVHPYELPAEVEGEIEAELDTYQQELSNEIDRAKVLFEEAMDDDFNTADAIARLFELVTKVNRYVEERELEHETPGQADKSLLIRAAQRIRQCAKVLRLFEEPVGPAPRAGIEAELVELLLEVRNAARGHRDYQLADRIRSRLGELGVVIEDHARGSTWRREGA